MPRRDVVLTGLIAFGAGVAVGANWPKIRRKIGPLLEKFGLQMADLGDFFATAGEDSVAEAAASAAPFKANFKNGKNGHADPTKAGKNARKAAATPADIADAFEAFARGGSQDQPASRPRPAAKRKTAPRRRRAVVVAS